MTKKEKKTKPPACFACGAVGIPNPPGTTPDDEDGNPRPIWRTAAGHSIGWVGTGGTKYSRPACSRCAETLPDLGRTIGALIRDWGYTPESIQAEVEDVLDAAWRDDEE